MLAGFFQPVYGQFQSEVHQLSREDMSAEDNTIYLSDVWLFQAGDNESWAQPSTVDTTWQNVSTYLGPSELPFLDWNGIGWFRLHLKVDSSLVNYSLALLVQQHNGASEIYLDGKRLAEIGRVSALKESYTAKRSFSPIPIIFSDTTEHVLAVRFANYDAAWLNNFYALGFTSGFRFLLGDLNYHTTQASIEQEEKYAGLPIFFIGSLLTFTVIHLLLYIFYPAGKRNLYFALFTGILVLLIYAINIYGITGSPLKALFYYRFSLICWLITIILALRFTYSLLYNKAPLQFWIFLGLAVLLSGYSWFMAKEPVLLRELFVLITLLEILRVLLVSFFREKRGIWIVAVGVLFFVGGIFYKMLIDLNLMTGDPVEGSIYGSAVMIFAMSIYLSRDFAKTNRQLEQKLREVKHLSERSLAQERINQQKEVERKLLSAENQRKSKELEEARQLQLSMLPKKIPSTDCWDIAVFMDTAEEVGGDYYDFSESDTQGLTIALGDATGHGMKAGIMVAAVKSYFHTLADGHELLQILEQISTGIRNMNLRLMFMGFQILKCKDNNVTFVSAGMPPPLWYKRGENSIEELRLKGLPLGTKARYPYRENNLQVHAGDVLLLMSDGLIELFNDNREQLGQERIKETLMEIGDSSASDILSRLTLLIDQWSGSNGHEDDITIIVMKAKEK